MKMRFIGAIVWLLVATVGFTQSFSDVPHNHWGAKAVEVLQEEGILVGFPPPDVSIRVISRATAIASIKRWRRLGLQVGYPDGTHSIPLEQRNRYEFAAASFAAGNQLLGMEKVLQSAHGFEARQMRADLEPQFAEIESVMEVMSMVAKELSEMGIDTRKVLRQLKSLSDRHGHLRFAG